MTTVDSWPKTLPMMSVGSWNSTTETHLIPAFWKKMTFSSLPTFIFWIKATFKCEWSVLFFRFGCTITIKLVKDTELSTFDSFTTKQGSGTPYLLSLLTNKMLLYLYRSIFIKVFVGFCRRLNVNIKTKFGILFQFKSKMIKLSFRRNNFAPFIFH